MASVFHSVLNISTAKGKDEEGLKGANEIVRAANIINEQHGKLNGRTHREVRWHKTWSCNAYRCENWILRLSLRRKLFSLNIGYLSKGRERGKKDMSLRVRVPIFFTFPMFFFPRFMSKLRLDVFKKSKFYGIVSRKWQRQQQPTNINENGVWTNLKKRWIQNEGGGGQSEGRERRNQKIGNELFSNACGCASHAMKCLLWDRVCVFCALQLIAFRNFKNGVSQLKNTRVTTLTYTQSMSVKIYSDPAWLGIMFTMPVQPHHF